jgi:hypothetical protein
VENFSGMCQPAQWDERILAILIQNSYCISNCFSI